LRQGAADDTITGGSARNFDPPSIEEVSALFPQLDFLELIGNGGIGAVYKARQRELDRIVALKILPPVMSEAPGFADRFAREAKALAKLNHPGIVTIHEFGRAGALFFILMEFVDGVNLRQLLARGRVSPREALAIVPAICDALQFAHDHGIVHRDIKPANVLIDRRGRVKVADFGLAKLVEEGAEAVANERRDATGEPSLTEAGKVLGTPSYMAPEQSLRPEEVDHRADIYALGVVFYELLTGELPSAQWQPPSRKVRIDVRLDEIVMRALEKEPALRYQQAEQVKTAVETVTAPASGAAPAGSNDPFVDEIVARDSVPLIRDSLRRGWELVRGDFWPLVGITALIVLIESLLGSAGQIFGTRRDHTSPGTGIFYLLLSGPLVGGLQLYFLRKIRGETVSVETAFAGFRERFLHLLLAGLVTTTLTALGYFCLVLPGVYLTIAWIFSLALVIDKKMHFWSAMELSRKVVTKHWWHFFAFALVLALLKLAGFLAFFVGFLIALPIATAALMFVYEDTFSSAAGPVAATPAPSPPSSQIRWGWIATGVAAFLVVLFLWFGARDHRAPPRARVHHSGREKTADAARTATAAPWLLGKWAFDAEYFKKQAQTAADAATDERQKAILQALTTATFDGAARMTWTITPTHMQSDHPQTGARQGPYRIIRMRDPHTAEIEVIDEGKPKRMLFRHEGERLALANANTNQKRDPLDLPAYYKRVADPLLER
jgi:predicted Ser/Thr protein kinase